MKDCYDFKCKLQSLFSFVYCSWKGCKRADLFLTFKGIQQAKIDEFMNELDDSFNSLDLTYLSGIEFCPLITPVYKIEEIQMQLDFIKAVKDRIKGLINKRKEGSSVLEKNRQESFKVKFHELLSACVRHFKVCGEMAEVTRRSFVDNLVSQYKDDYTHTITGYLTFIEAWGEERIESGLTWYEVMLRSDIAKMVIVSLKAIVEKRKDKEVPLCTKSHPVSERSEDKIFGIDKWEFVKLISELRDYEGKCTTWFESIILISNLCHEFSTHQQIIENLEITKGLDKARQMALDIMKEIESSSRFLSCFVIHSQTYLKLKVKMIIEGMIKRRQGQKPEGLYRPGDRVFFIRQRLHHSEYFGEVLNCFIAVVKEWDTCNKTGEQQAGLQKAFNVIKINGLDTDIYNESQFVSLMDNKLFEKSLMTAHGILKDKDTVFIEGLIKLIPIDEKHFDKLNSIIANIAKPKVDGVENIYVGVDRSVNTMRFL